MCSKYVCSDECTDVYEVMLTRWFISVVGIRNQHWSPSHADIHVLDYVAIAYVNGLEHIYQSELP